MLAHPPHNHSYYQDLLEEHIAGEQLTPGDRMDLFDHLEECDACRNILEAEERLTARMKTVPRLVAPSDLRSKILSQAIRDHHERTTAPSEDPHVADVLKPREATSDVAPRPAAPPNILTPTPNTPDLPVFAGVSPPRISPMRRAWRKASPVLATTFLTVASVGALYTGQFQAIPLVNEAQKIVWRVVDSAMGREGLPEHQATAIADAPTAPIEVHEASPLADEPATLAAATSPLPGTRQMGESILAVKRLFASANATASALAQAAASPVPAPAEDAAPQIAALVLKPTDGDLGTGGGFQPSALASALEDFARTQPGGRMATRDQFVEGGHRYRLYTLDLPAGATHQIVQTLQPYRTPADTRIVQTLATQNTTRLTSAEPLPFYSSDQSRLREALEAIRPLTSTPRRENLQIVVVE